MQRRKETTRLGLRVVGVATVSVGLFSSCSGTEVAANPMDTDWPAYGGDAGGAGYSSLTQIDVENVHQLEVA